MKEKHQQAIEEKDAAITLGMQLHHFRLIDLTREELHTMGVLAILDDEEEE